jgi:ribosomal protein L11 methyltransferase
MIWQQLSFRISGTLVGAANEVLENSGSQAITSQPADGEDQFDLAEPRLRPWQTTTLIALFDEQQALKPVIGELCDIFNIAPEDIRLQHIPDRDWERVWLENFKPVQISSNLWVCPSWCEPPDAEATNITLDPGLAFGTGTHATTALCLGALAGMSLAGKSVLDFGCGSGILAIAALKLGAASAIATDIDDKALQATKSNALINQVDDRLTILSSADAVSKIEQGDASFDVVIANILADALVSLQPLLTKACIDGGALLMSGILDHQQELVNTAYHNRQFTTLAQDEWIALESTPQ